MSSMDFVHAWQGSLKKEGSDFAFQDLRVHKFLMEYTLESSNVRVLDEWDAEDDYLRGPHRSQLRRCQ